MKATLQLANGTKVEIDGEPEEVRRLLADFSGSPNQKPPDAPQHVRKTTASRPAEPRDEAETITELAVVNCIKEDESLQWTHRILDSRDMTLRVLLPLYVASMIDASAKGVTSGFISRTYSELGVKVAVGNISTELSGRSKKYVIADVVRRKGMPVHYKISRAGRTFFEQGRNG